VEAGRPTLMYLTIGNISAILPISEADSLIGSGAACGVHCFLPAFPFSLDSEKGFVV